jgi:hypothetical protein
MNRRDFIATTAAAVVGSRLAGFVPKPSKKLSEMELAYIAGFFDGEGSLTIHTNCRKSPRGLVPNHTLQVSLANTNPEIVRWLHSVFGGQYLTRHDRRPGNRPVAQWIIRAAKALPFLEAIRPFVRMKTAQIDIAIAFQKTKKRGNTRVAPEVLEWREAQRHSISNLNKKRHDVERRVA